MTPIMRCFALILMGSTAILLGSCNRDKLSPTDKDSLPHEIAIDSTVADTSSPAIDSITFQAEVEPAATSTTPVQPKPKPHSKRQTLYISTYGANGEVWGHVTMNGNTGRGTIHDAGENTLSITVSRHGNELFGTDQNGRQYVFKL